MAESAAGFLVQKLTSLLVEEAKLLSGIPDEVTFIKDELQSMKAFLQKADVVEDEDPEIKAWVKQVRELAYNTEDLVDEFLYRFEHPQRPGLYGRLGKVARDIKTLKARRRIAAELQTVKSRVTDISQRHERYRNMPIIMETGSSSSSATNNVARQELRRNDARLLHENQLVGIDQPKQELVHWLLDDAVPNSQVAAVVGMGGLGKTTLVSQVYRDADVKQCFQHSAWITVSQSFNLQELLVKLIEQLFKGVSQQVPNATYSKDIISLKEDIIKFLGDTKYLVVLDDLWSVNSWDDLKNAFPMDNNHGSRLIVTTRKFDVASTTTRDVFGGAIFPLKTLSLEDSWILFCARTFPGNPCPHHLERVCRNIWKRCEGLPLAILAVSGVLATKDIGKINEWEMVSRHLGAGFDNSDQLKNMKKIISLSFNDLSYQLKSCFLFLSLFPEDWVFHKERIIRLWLAHGFVEERGNTTLEEVAEVNFSELCNRSLIQSARERTYEIFNTFKVHDIVREIILEKSKDQNFAATTSEQKPFLGRVRHLSVSMPMKSLQGDQNNFSSLRTLLFFNPERSTSSFSMSEFFRKHSGLRLLMVLDCRRLPLDTFPDCITKLYGLRFLNLNGTKVASLPRSIGRLRSLEILDLEETLIEELPVEISQLRRLQIIRVAHSVNDGSGKQKLIGARVPTAIGKLNSLQALYLIKASHGCVDLLRSLENLVQMRDLRIQQLGVEHGPALCSLIEKLSHLRFMSLESREEAEILDVQNISVAPQCLVELRMYGRLEMLPLWLPKLSSLVFLQLRWSKLELDPLESLQALPNLQILQFDKVYVGEELCVKAGGFQMLKELGFWSLEKLRKVTVEQGAMPRLQELCFEDCKSLEEVPSGVEFLSHLKEIEFINMGDELLTRLHSSSPNSDLSRVKHVPTVLTASRDAEGKTHSWKRI
ncbi:hypothetical protein TIFTF001_040022 [Ficus carica]|uniref:Disease resistance protein RPM1-like n=1 Tax=Ficus carica TaxID=3494 RepID=A0AA87YQV6_FICCA|nr:hypothetical protein TIFTF001_040022 [Ficus carica]